MKEKKVKIEYTSNKEIATGLNNTVSVIMNSEVIKNLTPGRVTRNMNYVQAILIPMLENLDSDDLTPEELVLNLSIAALMVQILRVMKRTTLTGFPIAVHYGKELLDVREDSNN